MNKPLERLHAQIFAQRCLEEKATLERPPAVVLPLRVAGEALGALYLRLREGQVLSEEAWSVLEATATLCAQALQQAQAERALQTLLEAIHLTAHTDTEGSFLERICALLVQKGGYPLAWVGMVREAEGEEQRVHPVAAAGATEYLAGTRVADHEPIGAVIRTGRPTVARFTQAVPWQRQALAYGLGSSLTLPLRPDNVVAGTLTVYASEPNAFDHDKVAFLTQLAELVSQGIARLRFRNQTQLLAKVVEQVQESILITDTSGRIIYANPAVKEHTGYHPEELIGKTPRVLKSGFHPRAFYKELWKTIRSGRPFRARFINRRKDRALVYVDKTIAPIQDAEGRITHFVSTERDISKELELQKRLQHALALRHALLELTNRVLSEGLSCDLLQEALRKAISVIPGAGAGSLLLKGKDGRFHYVAAVGHDLKRLKHTPWPREPLPASPSTANTPPDRPVTAGHGSETAPEQKISALIRVGDEILGSLNIDSFRPGTFSEESQELAELPANQLSTWLRWQQTQEEASYLAYHDPLTGLPNRRFFNEMARYLLNKSARSAQGAALAILDLDRFKEINDTLGHPVGDQLLQQVAARLCRLAPEEALVARLGGDEFALLFSATPEHATRILDQIQSGMSKPFEIEAQRLHTGFSAGIAFYPQDATALNELLRKADLALYEAKANRSVYAFYDFRLEQTAIKKRERTHQLQKALAEGQLVLHYQPVVRLEDRAVVGYEALLRWPQARIAPAEFIPLAEERGLIKALDRYVLRRAAQAGEALGAKGLRLNVNVSADSLANPTFLEFMTELPGKTHLTLEMTESGLAHPAVRVTLQQLAAMGLRTALDDFGTGYASMGYLAELPFDALKVDQGFTRGIGRNPKAEAVLRAIRDLARNLGIQVVVEGIETEAQRRWLIREGFTLGQGYLFGTPAPLALD